MCEKFPELNLMEFSFVLSVFYDGGTLYKRQSKSIWPLIITILNCNPNVRLTIGMGMFLLALHDLAVGCGAEQAIFKDLFVEELNVLGDGLIYSLTTSEGTAINVFIQARLIVHTYDTMALLKICKFPGN